MLLLLLRLSFIFSSTHILPFILSLLSRNIYTPLCGCFVHGSSLLNNVFILSVRKHRSSTSYIVSYHQKTVALLSNSTGQSLPPKKPM